MSSSDHADSDDPHMNLLGPIDTFFVNTNAHRKLNLLNYNGLQLHNRFLQRTLRIILPSMGRKCTFIKLCEPNLFVHIDYKCSMKKLVENILHLYLKITFLQIITKF